MIKIAHFFNLILRKNQNILCALFLIPLIATSIGCPVKDSKKQGDQASSNSDTSVPVTNPTSSSTELDPKKNNQGPKPVGNPQPVVPVVINPAPQVNMAPQLPPMLPPPNNGGLLPLGNPQPLAPVLNNPAPQVNIAPLQPVLPLNNIQPQLMAQPLAPVLNNPLPQVNVAPLQPVLPPINAQPQLANAQPQGFIAPLNAHAVQVVNNAAVQVPNLVPVQVVPHNVNVLENQARQYLAELRQRNYGLSDVILFADITTLDELKDAIGNLNLQDRAIVDDLNKFTQAIARWQNRNYKIKNEKDLRHVDNMLRKPGQFLDFINLFRDLAVPDDAFYEKIYNALNHDALLGQADFPDEDDRVLNGNDPVKILVKRDYLILALASIKNAQNNQRLSNLIAAQPITAILYPTAGQSQQWFAENRYKLYKISEMIDGLNGPDKLNVLSELLNAGKHCSDAKLASIEGALRLAHFQALKHLEDLGDALAVDLQQKMERVASKKKHVILTGAINDIWNTVIDPNVDNSRLVFGGPFAQWFQMLDVMVKPEEATYKTATWDHYAGQLGLKKKGATAPDQRLIIENNRLFGNGFYTTTALMREMRTSLKKDILDEYAGSLAGVVDGFAEDIIRGALIDHGFFVNK